MTRKILLLCVLVALALTGCAKVKKTYRWAMGGINPNPEVSLEAREFSGASEEFLAQQFIKVDEQVQELARIVEARDSYPEPAWFQVLFSKFPWISGVMVVESTGEVIDQQPDYSLKPLDYSPLLEVGEAWNDGRMRGHIQPTELGPEIFMANAYTKDRTWIGLTLVHFDFRSLMQFCPAPDKLVVLSPEAVLWPGADAEAAAEMIKAPWVKILQSDVSGEIELTDKKTSFTWLARYIGGKPIIYLVRDVPEE